MRNGASCPARWVRRPGWPDGDRRDRIDPENLGGRHRQGEPEQDSGHDGEGLAAIGRQSPGHDLREIVVDRAAFADRRDDRDEVVVGKQNSARS